jgi:hypothetical protein
LKGGSRRELWGAWGRSQNGGGILEIFVGLAG